MAYYKQVSKTYTPSSGGTVNIPAFDSDVLCCFIDTSGSLGSLTINLPAGAQDGQAIRIFFRNTITILNITFTTGALVGALTTILGGNSAVFAYKADSNEWWKG